MIIKVGFSWAKIERATVTEEGFLRDFLGFTVKGHGGLSRTESLYFPKARIFPAGLANLVVRSARERGYSVEVSHRSLAYTLDANHDFSKLWPHQKAGILKALEKERGIIQHATGTGKGTTISYLCGILHGRILVVVTSVQLLKEMYDRIKKWTGEAPGRVGGGYKELTKRVIVCCVPSLPKLPKSLLESFSTIIGDEVHGAASNSYWRPLMKCINAGIRLGFSGTPLNRADKRTLHIVGLFGEIIHKYTPEQAANDKVTAKATLRLVKCRIPPLFAERHAKDGNYVEWDKVALANNRVRNLKIGELLRSPSIPYPKILFVRTMHHQDVLRGQYGFSETEKIRYVNHKTPIDEIAKIKEGLEDGTVEILISGPIFRQGVDMKRIATVINAAGGKATVDVIQKVGRGARRLQDDGTEKEDFLMIDFDDQGCGCGGQDHRSCEWLERHSRLRRAAYEKFGYKPMDFQ